MRKFLCDHQPLIDQLTSERDQLRIQLGVMNSAFESLRDSYKQLAGQARAQAMPGPQRVMTREELGRRLRIPAGMLPEVDFEALGYSVEEGRKR